MISDLFAARTAGRLCCIVLLFLSTRAVAVAFTARQTISYEGYLEADGEAVSGDFAMNFALFECSVPGDCDPVWLAAGAWSDGWPEEGSVTVNVFQGRFHTFLGGDGFAEIPPHVVARPVLYLSIQVEGAPLALYQQITSAQSAWNGVPAGSIMAYGGATPPAGWLLCDGRSVSQEAYPALFAAVGTNWGEGASDGEFRLPDLRGRFLRGVDNGVGRDPDRGGRSANASGGNTGDNVGSVQGWATSRPRTNFTTGSDGAHVHPVDDYYYSENHNGNWGWLGSGDSDWDNRAHTTRHDTHSAGAHSHSVTGGGDNETRPNNANVSYIIKM